MDEGNQELKKVIIGLISKKQEGGYWDFKRKWHENKAELMHDIICLANNLENRDAYLIFGVDDKTYEIIGIAKDNNRKNTSGIVDILRSATFLGDLRPLARVESINIEGCELDILIVENSHNTPFALAKEYRDKTDKNITVNAKNITVNAKNIYTRIQDTNTPKDKTADIDKQEILWKKRFRIDQTPYKKALYYLTNPEDWEKFSMNFSDKYISNDEFAYPNLSLTRPPKTSYYYKFAPEYSIDFNLDRQDRENRDFLCLLFPDSSATFNDVTVRIHDQPIYHAYYSDYDGSRCMLISPRQDRININDVDGFWLHYIIKDSFEDKINNFLIEKQYDESTKNNDLGWDYCMKVWREYVIVFNSEDEKSQFKEYIISKYDKDLISQKIRSAKSLIVSELPYGVESSGLFDDQYRSMQILKKEYEEWVSNREQ